MELMVKIAMAGVLISVLALILRSVQNQFAPLIVAAGSAVLLIVIINMSNDAIIAIKSMFKTGGLEEETVSAVIKIVGAAYIVEFSASLCRDMGENSVAAKIEAAGRIFIMLMTLPWAATLIETVKRLGA